MNRKRIIRPLACVAAVGLTAGGGAVSTTALAAESPGSADPGQSEIDLVWNSTTLSAENASAARLTTHTGQPQRRTQIVLKRDSAGIVTDRIVSHERRDAAGKLRPLRWSASSKTVTLNWLDIASVGRWRVSVNGKTVGSQDGTEFTYPSSSSRADTYTVEGTKSKVVDGRRVDAPVTYSVTVPPSDTSSIGKPVTDATKSLARNQDIAAGTEKTRYFQWLSFIPQHHIDASLLCKALNTKVKYFSGDNRGFLDNSMDPDMYDSAWKTRARVSARVGSSWDKSQAPDSLNGWIDKQVGTSHGYDASMKMVESKNAGTSGVELRSSGIDATTSLTYRNVKSSVALPLCPGAPAISWNFFYTARTDGWISVTGEFDQAPSTELLWDSTTNSQDPNAYKYGCWFRFNNKGFEKLAPVFPNAEVDLDANPDIARPACIEK